MRERIVVWGDWGHRKCGLWIDTIADDYVLIDFTDATVFELRRDHHILRVFPSEEAARDYIKSDNEDYIDRAYAHTRAHA